MNHLEALMQQLQPSQVIEIPGFILASPYGSLTHCGVELDGYMTIAPHTIQFTVPEGFNVVASSVAALDKQLDTLAEEYHTKTAGLREKKEQLLQLGHNAGRVVDMAKGDPE